jgi:hypothetical protein
MQKSVCFCRHPGESRGPDFGRLDSGVRRNDDQKESHTGLWFGVLAPETLIPRRRFRGRHSRLERRIDRSRRGQ